MTHPVPVCDTTGDASHILFMGLRDRTDLLMEVLLRLPPWSLCQLRCVCKQWRDETTTSTFLSTYSCLHTFKQLNWLLVDRTIFFDTAPTPRGPPRASLRRSEPPAVSTVIASPRLCPVRQNVFFERQPSMVVSYSGGLILLSTHDHNYYVCNPFTGDTFLHPVPKPALHHSDGLSSKGVCIAARDGEYVVAQLWTSCLRCFSSVTGQWEEKAVVCPEFFKSNMVFASGGMLHWVDLSHGILSCDPFAPVPATSFLNLPEARSMSADIMDEWIGVRYVGMSARRLWFFEIDDKDGECGTMNLWVLGGNGSKWELEHKIDFADLWVDESCDDYELPVDEVPHVGLVDPLDDHIVYVIADRCLFTVDLRTKQLLNCCTETNIGKDVGSLPPIPCVLPPFPHKVSPYPTSFREVSSCDPLEAGSSSKPQKSGKGRRRKSKT